LNGPPSQFPANPVRAIITNEEYAIFQNAGYKGLYGGLTVANIHARKGLEPDEKILDFMGSTELIAKTIISVAI
jgi:hypothetical protein